MFKKFLFDDVGATAIEYTLIAAAMSAALVVSMPLLRVPITTAFQTIIADISGS